MAKYRKKPVVIDAVQFALCEYADKPSFYGEVPDWIKTAEASGTIRPEFRGEDYWYLVIRTLEGDMTADPHDWIIRGIKGEIYACKPDIFAATYDLVDGTE